MSPERQVAAAARTHLRASVVGRTLNPHRGGGVTRLVMTSVVWSRNRLV